MLIQKQTNDYLNVRAVHDAESQRIKDLIDKKENQIERLSKKLDKLAPTPFWGEALVKPIVDELVLALPDGTSHDASFVPLGITACITIFFHNASGNTIGMIGFRPGNLYKGEIMVVDYANPTFRGDHNNDPNGRRFPGEPLPETIDELVKFVTEDCG